MLSPSLGFDPRLWPRPSGAGGVSSPRAVSGAWSRGSPASRAQGGAGQPNLARFAGRAPWRGASCFKFPTMLSTGNGSSIADPSGRIPAAMSCSSWVPIFVAAYLREAFAQRSVG
jgi:hypothetical protein